MTLASRLQREPVSSLTPPTPSAISRSEGHEGVTIWFSFLTLKSRSGCVHNPGGPGNQQLSEKKRFLEIAHENDVRTMQGYFKKLPTRKSEVKILWVIESSVIC